MAEWYKEAGDAIREDMIALSDSIFSHPELGYEEFLSAEEHAEVLRKYGFTVEKPYMGLETGYRATFDSGKPGPRICYMAEYDALPGVGHGCGHNMLGTTSVAAGIILSKKIAECGGSVVVLGTPAEETSGAKVKYAREGAFDDCAVAIVNHPCIGGHMRSGRSLALITLEAVFDGKPAHAASAPEKGINALDAATIMNVAVGLLRQQTREDARIHGIITEGGLAPNVIPDHVVARFYVRAADRVYRDELLERVKNCARAGALATDCKLTMSQFEEPYDDLMTNEALSAVMCESLKELGIEEVEDPAKSFGSLDAGNVSYVCPTIHPYFPIGQDRAVANHTPEFGACTQTDFAKDSMMTAAEAMALTGYRVITEPHTLAAIRKEFDAMPK